ncbi:MAG: sigma-70 family RNA polymerase sigma factor [Clostridia bacterium]|nr:sigma-70 family RNA polymerase sigma factor [Clostridia bacterium]
MEDDKLLRLLHNDPNSGMEQLMDQYAGLVYAVIKGKLSESYHVSSDIEDCAADVFSEFYTQLSKYDPNVSSIKTYLCVLARHRAIDIVRKREKQKEDLSLDDEECFYQLSDALTIDVDLAQKEVRHRLFSNIKALGEPDASIILRKYYFGQSSKEIAAALRLTVSNVDTRAYRALFKLRKMFGGEQL